MKGRLKQFGEWGISSVYKYNKGKKVPLQRYWTTRYIWTLAIGLVIVAVISAWWIRQTTLEDRLTMMEFMAEEIANQTVRGHSDDEQSLSDVDVREFLTNPGKYMDIDSTPVIFITDTNGSILYENKQANRQPIQLNPALLEQELDVQQMEIKDAQDHMYMVKKPVAINHTILGWVVLLEWKNNLSEVNQEYRQLFVMIAALAIFGSIAIYILSNRLAKPITAVAKAAEQIKVGKYDVELQDDVKEKEVYELIQSFKAMSDRLEQLEALRTELLAGVTHELKTPVTSISGLIQAVNDDVVEGEEAKEFLRISLEETAKMEKLVEDLLAFNAFAADTLPLVKTTELLNELIHRTIHRWEVTQDGEEVEDWTIDITMTSDEMYAKIDPIRIEQIIVNLLNNARDARQGKLEIAIRLSETEENVYLDVTDHGMGIPSSEQPYIFERFYRGKVKQSQISGFGLGLAFSKMIAQAHGGDLMLITSTKNKTTFRLILPKETDENHHPL